jgi:hypothetical protein
MSISSAQSTVTSIQRDIQTLNRKLADLAKDEASKTAKIISVQKSIGSRISLSNLQSKQREIQNLQNDISSIQSKKASVSKDLAAKTERLHKAQAELFNEQQKEQKKTVDSLVRKNREMEDEFSRRLQNNMQIVKSDIKVTEVGIVQNLTYDVFISHASEDKEKFVRPLAELLKSMGISVWYDEFQLKVGDSLRGNIDKGLASSRFGVVVISAAFFKKEWPQRELNGLFAREIEGQKVILPIWHEISKTEVLQNSPMLADKIALNSSLLTLEQIADELFSIIRA